jgi:hypothetical protein
MRASGHLIDRVNVLCFVGILLCGAVLFWVMPKDRISEYEKRELKKLPEFSSAALFSGEYFRGLEAYYSDNFVFRLTLTKIASEIQQSRGFADDGIRLFQGKPPQAALAPTGDGAPLVPVVERSAEAPAAAMVATATNAAAQPGPTALAPPPGQGMGLAVASAGVSDLAAGATQTGAPASSGSSPGQTSGSLAGGPAGPLAVAHSGPTSGTPAGSTSGASSGSTSGTSSGTAATIAAPSTVQQPTGRPQSSTTDAPLVAPALPSSPALPVGVPAASENEGAFQNINSVVVFRQRAIQIFGGSEQMVAPYAALLKKYREELPPSKKIYCMAIPVGSDFYLPKKVNRGVMREKANIDYLYSMVGGAVQTVNAYEQIGRHRDEYIQFNTDHHWTGLGAYYAYLAFAQSAQFEPLPLASLIKKEIPNFLGTLYYRTLSAELKSNPDRVEYYMIPNKTEVLYYPKGIDKGLPTRLYAEYAKGGSAYGVFLGGDYPLMRVMSGIKNGRKIVVVKDSYGNAFVPYLAAHFEEVLIVDYRYFNGSIPTLMDTFGANEILFAHNTYVLNNSYTVARERSMLAKVKGVGSGS